MQRLSFKVLATGQWYGDLGSDNPSVAVRSSATAEDLPEMSSAGQQETYLNVRGDGNVLVYLICATFCQTRRPRQLGGADGSGVRKLAPFLCGRAVRPRHRPARPRPAYLARFS